MHGFTPATKPFFGNWKIYLGVFAVISPSVRKASSKYGGVGAIFGLLSVAQ